MVHREGRLDSGGLACDARIDGPAGAGAADAAVGPGAAIPASAARRLVVGEPTVLDGQGRAELDDRAALTIAPVAALSPGTAVAAGGARGLVAGERTVGDEGRTSLAEV